MKDFLIQDGTLMIANGDLVIGDSDQQHQERLLLTEKGNIKQFPDAGVGALNYIEAEDPAELVREISVQFTADGMNVIEVKIDNGQLLINAPYGNS